MVEMARVPSAQSRPTPHSYLPAAPRSLDDVRKRRLLTNKQQRPNNTKQIMKRRLTIILNASAASMLAFAGLAQDPTLPRPANPDYARDRVPTVRSANRLNGAAKSTDLIGMEVKNLQNEKLGKVQELAVDLESGRVVQVILSTGGFIGVGDTLTAVPPGALHHDVAQKVLHLDTTKERLKNAPKFETAKWTEYSDSAHVTTVYRYYGQEHAYTFVQRDSQANTPNTSSTRKPDGTWDKDRVTGDSQFMIPASRLSHLQKASKLNGTAVKNLQDEKLGDVNNLLVDMPSGRIVAVVISTGGFLGMGDELSAVPPSALQFTPDRDTLQLDASKEMLAQAPHFKANQWPDFTQPAYAGGIYRAYKVEPYFTTDGLDSSDTRRNVRDRDYRTTEPDNSGRNVRDRNDQTATSFDQGNNQADVDTTAQIRKEITATKGMSTNARNVKIITNGGRVILRGPVNSAEEKRLIGEIANRIATTGNVDNQLEIKSDN